MHIYLYMQIYVHIHIQLRHLKAYIYEAKRKWNQSAGLLRCWSIAQKTNQNEKQLLHNKEGKSFSNVQSCICIAQDTEHIRKLKKTQEVSFYAIAVTTLNTASHSNWLFLMCNTGRAMQDV